MVKHLQDFLPLKRNDKCNYRANNMPKTPTNKHTSLRVSLRASLRNDCILHRHKQGKGMSPAITNQADS